MPRLAPRFVRAERGGGQMGTVTGQQGRHRLPRGGRKNSCEEEVTEPPHGGLR